MNKKGFTLAELLIVVAIIAVLVAISIPIFTTQLEKSREATDLANVRGAYATIMSAAMSDDKDSVYDGETIYQNGVYTIDVELVQKKYDWDTKGNLSIGGISKENDFGTKWLNIPLDNNTNVCTVTYNPADTIITIDWTGGKVSIPHIYEFDEGYNFDELVFRNSNKRYIYLTNDPYISADYRHTAIQKLFDLDSNNAISFNVPSQKEANKYLDTQNYNYNVSVDFVDPNDTMKLNDTSNIAYCTTNGGKEVSFNWGSGNLEFQSSQNPSAKAMIDVSKTDNSGNFVEMTIDEIDYIMSLLKK